MPSFEYDRELSALRLSRQKGAIKDYYTVTPKGFQLENLISARMKEIEGQKELLYTNVDKDSPEWQEYLRLFHTQHILILASSSHGVFINPVYQAEEEEALEDLLEGGYIVRASS